MHLSAKTMYTGRWGAVVAPSNETELVESRTARKFPAMTILAARLIHFP
jgi:hypothetical protein